MDIVVFFVISTNNMGHAEVTRRGIELDPRDGMVSAPTRHIPTPYPHKPNSCLMHGQADNRLVRTCCSLIHRTLFTFRTFFKI